VALAAQGWNLLGGFCGQFSFGHAAFFGTGAYVTAVLQSRYGVNAWVGFAIGILAGAAIGWIIGFLSFRAGLRGSYFALITLAFAEVLRISANAAPITGGGTGLLLKLDVRAANFQFASRGVFCLIVLARPWLFLFGSPARGLARSLRRCARTRMRPAPWASTCWRQNCVPSRCPVR
jgi:branched-chain amino acid transport system permease protein